MIVTGIEEFTKSRSRVFLDGEFAFVLYKGELRHYHLKVGEAVSEADYGQIMGELLPKRAKLRAMNLLLKKDYTTAQLREKLQKGEYPADIVQQALDYVEAFHYTDDLRYATDYITYHQDSKTKLRLEQDLRARGIPKDVLEEAWKSWEQAGGCQHEEEMIGELLRKRGYDPENATPTQQKKEYGFLMRKGFSAEKVRRAIWGRSEMWGE